jgi:hypothetical protein
LILLLLFPIIWLVLLPFQLLGWGITVSLSLIGALIMLPFTLLR